MKIDLQQHGIVIVLRPHGALAADDVDAFTRAMQDATDKTGGRVVVDMSDVPFLDSRGIETLLQQGAGQSGVNPPTFAALGETCREALDLTEALPRLRTFDTVENAIRSHKR